MEKNRLLNKIKIIEELEKNEKISKKENKKKLKDAQNKNTKHNTKHDTKHSTNDKLTAEIEKYKQNIKEDTQYIQDDCF